MDEQQILKQLNRLQDEVKPREQWVNMTKRELLNSQQQKAAATLISKAFAPLQKPALALAAISLIALVLSGAVFYSPQLVKVEEPMPRISSDQAQLTASLTKLSASLTEINEGLKNLKEVEDPNETFALITTLESATEEGQRAATSLAASTENPQVLGAVGQFQESLNEIERKIQEAENQQKQQIEELIDKIENNKNYLSEEERGYLDRAQQAFDEENIGITLLFISKINN
ncbi:hypothetical protein AKJ56_01970 [candidate division MSBL1 archaeon SCGC-AAA382N08]|uniref:DUF5667 domain-containing protein n=1 Tax=candidate division MSBL1 archaeon SCGC-AAA382N08 TaxID=1698285 RepID=A0A133VNL6_9EURY|nr:hypothetical protein AKJ56_01970 [candidate division MSBL1 archaeon SCGC-AAA382N08]